MDREDEHIANWITQRITNVLAELPGIRVVSLTAITKFRIPTHKISINSNKPQPANVLEGAVRKAGSRIRVELRLVNFPLGYIAWASSHHWEIEDGFVLEGTIRKEMTFVANQLLRDRRSA